ncbi:MAG: glycosyltransferase family 39 protein, partial [Phycisphaerae bacterium]|nr:glycosyltransferase family 39 protein [Phycisphaerae bacterium]
IVLLFFLTKKLFGPLAGTAAAVFFALMSISKSIEATANAENFVVLPAIAGIILLIKFAESKKYISLITGGIWLGIGFMAKQHGAAFIIFGFLFLVWQEIKHRPFNWKRLIFVNLIYGFCAVLPFLVTCLILWRCGVFAKFWFWTFEYARHYISINPFEIAFGRLKGALTDIVPAVRFIWLSALFGLLSIIWNKEIRKQWLFLVCFLICSFLSVCPGFYFRHHYFVLFLPAICVFAAVGVIAVRELLGKIIKSRGIAEFIAVLIILTIWLHGFYSQRNYLLESDPVKISRADFGINPFPESLKIAEYIKANSNPDDKILILGSEPQIFFYSQRRSATPYIYIYPLMEPHPYAHQMQQEMIDRIKAENPRFLIIVKFSYSWLIRDTSERFFMDWVDRNLLSRYRQIGLVDTLSAYKTSYLWDSTARPSKESDWILIGERIDSLN